MCIDLFTDILIIGGGSAGVGATLKALELSKGSQNVLLIEKEYALGGTATLSGVNCWEPGVGGFGFHSKIAEKLLENKVYAGVGITKKSWSYEEPWAFQSVNDQFDYECTTMRAGLEPCNLNRFHYEPEAMMNLLNEMICEHPNVNLMFNTEFIGVEKNGSNIKYIYAYNKKTDEKYRIYSKVFIDCSADIVVARSAGCAVSLGEDSESDYNEPCAPKEASNHINGISQIFRVKKIEHKHIDNLSSLYKSQQAKEWLQKKVAACTISACINEYPNGDLNINMLPTMDGEEFLKHGYEKAQKICKERVAYYWDWLQEKNGFNQYTFDSFFPNLGIRETYRLKGRYVLNEIDARAGFSEQKLKGEFVAFSDHALDVHGKTNINGPRCGELKVPYGIPFSCLITNELNNLLVACRGSSFSHIAASSCRLSRTMMAIGEAAGVAAVLACEKNCLIKNISVKEIRKLLKINEFEEYLMNTRDKQ